MILFPYITKSLTHFYTAAGDSNTQTVLLWQNAMGLVFTAVINSMAKRI